MNRENCDESLEVLHWNSFKRNSLNNSSIRLLGLVASVSHWVLGKSPNISLSISLCLFEYASLDISLNISMNVSFWIISLWISLWVSPSAYPFECLFSNHCNLDKHLELLDSQFWETFINCHFECLGHCCLAALRLFAVRATNSQIWKSTLSLRSLAASISNLKHNWLNAV